jgi:hypothetical protein
MFCSREFEWGLKFPFNCFENADEILNGVYHFQGMPSIFERGLIREIAIGVWRIEEIVPISRIR